MLETLNLPTEKEILDIFKLVAPKGGFLVGCHRYDGERKRDFFMGNYLQATLSKNSSGNYVFDFYSNFGFQGEYWDESNHILNLALKLKTICEGDIGISVNLRKIWESDDMDNDEERNINFTPHCVVKAKSFDVVEKIIKILQLELWGNKRREIKRAFR